MAENNLKFELKELPLDLLDNNIGQIDGVPRNPRKCTKERMQALIESHRTSPEMERLNELIVYPHNGRYVVMSGNHRLKARKQLGWEKTWCKVLGEETPKEKLREYVIKENVMYAQDDAQILKEAWNIKELINWDMPFITASQKTAEYSRKVESPVYVPTGEVIGSVAELYDDSKVTELEQLIKVAEVPEDVREMLMKAAQRFRKFDFAKVAEYYSQCKDKTVRSLFEKLALVIVDFGGGIENGFVELTDKITEEYLKEYGDEEEI